MNDDMPMVGKLTRMSKKRDTHGLHKFVLAIRFKKSGRSYGEEFISATDRRHAKRQAKKFYPHVRVK